MAVALNEDETVVHTYPSLSTMSCTSLLSKSQRLLLGLLLLLFVNVIWVLSSELTKVTRSTFSFSPFNRGFINIFTLQYIFLNADYDKPFFTTYFKTSMFMVYLLGFAFSKSWRNIGQNIEYQVWFVLIIIWTFCVQWSDWLQQLKQDVLDEPEDLASVIVSMPNRISLFWLTDRDCV